MTTRREIEEVVRQYGHVPHDQLPSRFRDPQNEHDANLALGLVAASRPDIELLYDDDDEVAGWVGLKPKSQ